MIHLCHTPYVFVVRQEIPECLSSSDIYVNNPEIVAGTNLVAPLDYMRQIKGLNVLQESEESPQAGLEKALRAFIGYGFTIC